MSIEAMKQALEALEIEYRMYEATDPETGAPYNMIQAITSLRQAIAEAEKQEPVAWMRTSGTGSPVVTEALLVEMPEMRWNFQQPLYTHPQPKREPL